MKLLLTHKHADSRWRRRIHEATGAELHASRVTADTNRNGERSMPAWIARARRGGYPSDYVFHGASVDVTVAEGERSRSGIS